MASLQGRHALVTGGGRGIGRAIAAALTQAGAAVTIAAADRNYVNWERGGNFNPSGAVRVASIRGGGTGVFGSMVPLTFTVTVGGSQPACKG